MASLKGAAPAAPSRVPKRAALMPVQFTTPAASAISRMASPSLGKDVVKTPDTVGHDDHDGDGYSDMDPDSAPAIRAWEPLVDGGAGHKVTIIDFAAIELRWSREHGIQADTATDAGEVQAGQDDDDNDDDDDQDMDEDDDAEIDGDDAAAPNGMASGSSSSASASSSSSSSSSSAAASAAGAGGSASDAFAVPDSAEMRGAGRMLAIIHKYQSAAEDQLSTGYDDDSFIDDEQILREVAQRNETKAKTVHGEYFVHQGAEPIAIAGDEAEGVSSEALDRVRSALDAYLAEHSGEHLSLGSRCDQLLAELRSATSHSASQTTQQVLASWPYQLDDKLMLVEAEAVKSHIPRVTEHAGYIARLLQSVPVTPAVMKAHLVRLRKQKQRDLLFERTEQLLQPLREAVAAALARKPIASMQKEEAERKRKIDQRHKTREAVKAAQSAGQDPPTSAQLRAIESAVPMPDATGLRWFQMDAAVKAAVREYIACMRSAIEAEMKWRELLRPADRDNEAKKARLREAAAAPVYLGTQPDASQAGRGKDIMPESFLVEGYREKKVVTAFLTKAVEAFPEGSVISGTLRSLERRTRRPTADTATQEPSLPATTMKPPSRAAAASSSSSSSSAAAAAATQGASSSSRDRVVLAAKRGVPISACIETEPWKTPSNAELESIVPPSAIPEPQPVKRTRSGRA